MRKNIVFMLLALIVSLGAVGQNNVKIEELNDASFKKKVWDYSKNAEFNRVGNLPIILDFHATWCRPCKMLAPHLQEIQNKYNGKLVVYKIDVDQQPELAKKFGVRAMPTIVFVDSKTGYKTELGYRDLDAFEELVTKYFFTK